MTMRLALFGGLVMLAASCGGSESGPFSLTGKGDQLYPPLRLGHEVRHCVIAIDIGDLAHQARSGITDWRNWFIETDHGDRAKHVEVYQGDAYYITYGYDPSSVPATDRMACDTDCTSCDKVIAAWTWLEDIGVKPVGTLEVNPSCSGREPGWGCIR